MYLYGFWSFVKTPRQLSTTVLVQWFTLSCRYAFPPIVFSMASLIILLTSSTTNWFYKWLRKTKKLQLNLKVRLKKIITHSTCPVKFDSVKQQQYINNGICCRLATNTKHKRNTYLIFHVINHIFRLNFIFLPQTKLKLLILFFF